MRADFKPVDINKLNTNSVIKTPVITAFAVIQSQPKNLYRCLTHLRDIYPAIPEQDSDRTIAFQGDRGGIPQLTINN